MKPWPRNSTLQCSMSIDARWMSAITAQPISCNPSDGFTALWEKNRLDFSVDALVQREPWRTFFCEDDIRRAAKQLRDYGFVVPENS